MNRDKMWTRDFLLTSRILKASVPCTFLHHIAQNPEPTTQHHLISLLQNSIEFKCDGVSETKKSIDLPHNKFQIIFFFHRNELEGKGFWETKRGRGGGYYHWNFVKNAKKPSKIHRHSSGPRGRASATTQANKGVIRRNDVNPPLGVAHKMVLRFDPPQHSVKYKLIQ